MSYNITPQQAYEWLKNGEAVLIDVREPEEFMDRHISYAQSLPLSCLSDSIADIHFPHDRKVIMQCLAGRRGETACGVLSGRNLANEIFNIEGGISAWESAGFPVIGVKQPKFSIFRQVQMIVGSLILALIILGLWGVTLALVLAGVFAGALMFAGITGWCGLAMLLQRMPWNR